MVDVTVVDALAFGRGSAAEMRRRVRTVGQAAEEAERRKRNKRGGANNERMEDRVKARGMTFLAVGFETSGAETSACCELIKKLSEIAHARRGHDKAYFRARWLGDIAMTLAKRGAQVALDRAYAVGVEQRVGQVVEQQEDEDDGPLGGMHAEPYTHGTIDDV